MHQLYLLHFAEHMKVSDIESGLVMPWFIGGFIIAPILLVIMIGTIFNIFLKFLITFEINE